MARNRMIKPEFWEDVKIAKLNIIERLLFIALWNFADDEGFLPYDLQWIKAKVFPYDKRIKIKVAIHNLLSSGFLKAQNDTLLIKNFTKHQRLCRPSESKLKANFENHSQNEEKFNECSMNAHNSFTLEVKGSRKEVEKNRKEINKEKKTDSFFEQTQNPKGQVNQDLQKAFGEFSAFVETDSPLAKEIERHIAFCKQCNFVLRGGYRGYLQKLFNLSGGIGNIAYEIVCVLLEAKSCNIRPLTDGEYRAFAAKQKKRGQEQKDIEKSNAFEEKDVKVPDGIADLIKPKEIIDTRTFDEKKQEALRKAKLLTG